MTARWFGCAIVLVILSQPLLAQRPVGRRESDNSGTWSILYEDDLARNRVGRQGAGSGLIDPARNLALRDKSPPHRVVPADARASVTSPGPGHVVDPSEYFDPDGVCSEACPPPPPQGPPGRVVLAPCYGTLEAMFLRRTNDNFTQPMVVDVDSGNTLLSTDDFDFDYESGVRATLGLRAPCGCCDSALEVTYLGAFDWDSSEVVTGFNNLAVAGDLGFVVNGFTLAESIRADYGSRLDSVESNYVRCLGETRYCGGYRRIDGLVGFRYLSFDENLSLLGNNQNVANAIYNVDSENNLYGAQIGSRMRSHNGYWGWELLGKAGVFANHASQRQSIVDELGVNDFLVRDAAACGSNTAFVGELGLSLFKRVSCACGVRGGYNLLWIEDIALAPDQLDFSDTAQRH